MIVRSFREKYGFSDQADFATWLEGSGFRFTSMWKYDSSDYWDIADDQDLDHISFLYRGHATALGQEVARRLDEENSATEKKKAALASMLITSGFNFDGYTITKYSGYISGDDAIQVKRGADIFLGIGTTDVGAALMESLVQIRRKALIELKEAAYALGCNAVVGVDFDYITLDPETKHLGGGTSYQPYVFGVTANGNAVIIEKSAVLS